jgi:hypothetical protein
VIVISWQLRHLEEFTFYAFFFAYVLYMHGRVLPPIWIYFISFSWYLVKAFSNSDMHWSYGHCLFQVIAEYLQKVDPKSDGAKRDWVAIYDECASVLYQVTILPRLPHSYVRFLMEFRSYF